MLLKKSSKFRHVFCHILVCNARDGVEKINNFDLPTHFWVSVSKTTTLILFGLIGKPLHVFALCACASFVKYVCSARKESFGVRGELTATRERVGGTHGELSSAAMKIVLGRFTYSKDRAQFPCISISITKRNEEMRLKPREPLGRTKRQNIECYSRGEQTGAIRTFRRKTVSSFFRLF